MRPCNAHVMDHCRFNSHPSERFPGFLGNWQVSRTCRYYGDAPKSRLGLQPAAQRLRNLVVPQFGQHLTDFARALRTDPRRQYRLLPLEQ